MKKKSGPKSPISKKAAFVVLPLVLVLVLVVVLGIIFLTGSKREVVFKDYGYAFVNTNRLMSIMKVPGAEADISEIVCVLSSDGKALIGDDSIEYRGEELSMQLPLFFDNNSYIYIPWEDAVFLDKDIRLRKVEGNAFLINDAFFGDDYTIRDAGKDLLLLSCTRNLFLALDEFTVTSSGESFKVSPMELVLFDSYSIKKAGVSDSEMTRSAHGITTDSLVTVNGRSYVMSDFLAVLGLTVDRESNAKETETLDVDELDVKKEAPRSIEEGSMTVPEATYQYVLGNRYDLPENLEVYKLGETWYQKREELATQLQSAPLYGEEYIYLPCNYGLSDTENEKQFSLPAFSKISKDRSEDGEVTAVSPDGVKKILPRGVLYDGFENFLFTEAVTLSWGDKSFELAPFSCVTYDGFDRLDFYDTGEDKSYSYILQAGSVRVLFEDGGGVDVIKRDILLPDGSELIVASEPGMYRSFFE